MSEENNSTAPVSKPLAYLAAAGTVVGALFCLANPAIPVLAAIGGAVYAATREKPMETVKSFFGKVGGFYKGVFAQLRGDYKDVSAWAEQQEAARKAQAAETPSTFKDKQQAPGFNQAVTGEKPAAEKAPAAKPAPAPKPEQLKM